MENNILSRIISIIMEYTVKPVGRQVGYLIHYKRNFENLRSQLENLDAAKDRMKHKVDEEERKGKKVHTDVQKWLTEPNKMIQEANKLLEDEHHAKTKCFCGVCPNLVSYHQLSRKSAKLAKKIELHHDKKEFPIVSYNAPLEEICVTPSQNYMAFESRISMVKEIMEELNNPNSNMIGVYGLGGVGKTTLAQEVYRQAKKEKLFDEVVIVLDVKKYPDLEKKERIQNKIAEQLGMEVDEIKDIEARAKHLWNRIKDKNIFVILDDIWEAIDLEALGLCPMATCKILLTSRDRVSQMHMQKEFRLEALGMEENWSLFEKMTGDIVNKDDCIHEVATKIAEKCGGLPVSVIAVATSLRKATTLEEWRASWRDFKSFDKQGLAKSAYLALEWSYNRLEGDELKPLFLLCGIIAGSGCSIPLSDLLKYAMGLGFVKNVDTVEDARDKLISLTKKLIKDYCLLLDIDDDGDFRIHELVRDVAIGIGCKDNNAILKFYGDELKEWPDTDSLKKCTAISLESCKIPRLPEVPWVCPKLRFFHLRNDKIDDPVEIPGNYFEGMNEVKVLDVTKLRVPSLPPSLQSLTNLQTLCLDHCVLGDIALVGQLTNLKILSLIYSQVKELPKEIGQLTRLQLLDLTGCSELVLISPGVISSLTSLEDLRIGSFKEWEGGLIDGRSNASVSELKHLRQLTALDIHIPDAKLLPANMFSDTRLERYTILIGDCWLYPNKYGTSSNMLKLKLTTNSQFGQGIKFLLKRFEHLDLDGMEAANIISYILGSDSGKQLKNLHVQNNDEVTTVINSSHAFPILESLSLSNLVNLETVCCGQLITQPFQKLRSLILRNLPKLIGFSSKGSRSVVSTEAEEIILENEIGGPTKLFMNGEVMLPNLTTLIMHQCDGLRFLFSFSMATSLVQLTHLQISSCQIMEEIVTKIGTSEENTDNIFRKLKHLQLQHLPSLTRFCSGSYVEFPSLELLHLEDCSEGVFIFHSKIENVTVGKQTKERGMKDYIETDVPLCLLDEKVGFPSLESLMIYDMPKLKTIWHCQLAPDSFRQLKKVEVLRCHSLISIFAPSIMGRLDALDTLKIKECKSLQVVFEQTYDTSTTELKTFECPNLDLVEMDSCESLKSIFPASVAKGLQQLSKLCVLNCGILEEIVAKEGEVETTPEFEFPKVKYLTFDQLPQLRSFYSGLYVSKWPLLKELNFRECGKVEIFASEYSIWQKRLDSSLDCTLIKQPFLLVEKVLNVMPNLTDLYLYRCDGLRFLFSCSMARNLVQLTRLEILGCEMMEEIVSTSGYNQEHNMFCNLKSLRLQDLPSLTRFCSGSYIEFSSLDDLFIYECPRLGTFIFDGSKSEITTMGKENDDRSSMENLETVTTMDFLFDEKVGFPSLETLTIHDLPTVMTIWHNQLAPNSFCKLRKVQVQQCHNLINIFAPSMMGRLNALDTLEISTCKSLQAVFKEIVAKEGVVETTPEFEFPKLTSLTFFFLPQLRSFYSGMHVSKWPLLKEVFFGECGKVEIFASEYSRLQERLDSGLVSIYTPIKRPFLLVDKGNPFPTLERLDLDRHTEIWYAAHGPLPAELFVNLKRIGFSCAHPNSFAFLEKLHGLEELKVDGGPWKEIFVYEGTSSGEIDAVGTTLPHIKNLCLKKMELMHLGNDNSESIFPNLEILEVSYCDRLKNLTSSAISFRNLTTLQVMSCDGLKYLVTYSVAKCLHRLKELEVAFCKSITELVASNVDEQDSENYYEIAFNCLQRLQLLELPSLRGFCSSGNCTVRVPYLNSLNVRDCQIELKISPDGSLIQSGSRPERQQITEEEEEEEEDDGNETGKQLIAHTN